MLNLTIALLIVFDVLFKAIGTYFGLLWQLQSLKVHLITYLILFQVLFCLFFVLCGRDEVLQVCSKIIEIKLCLKIVDQLFVSALLQQSQAFFLYMGQLHVSTVSFPSKQIQIWNFRAIHPAQKINYSNKPQLRITISRETIRKGWFSYNNYNNMSEYQTLSMVNNDTENKNISQECQFRELSVKDESVANFDLRHTPQQIKQTAINFLNSYNKLDELFPLNKLKESPNLKYKPYKESAYYGEFHNGKKHGSGIMIYKNQRIYEGEWSNDTKKGYGAEKFPNQCIYKGQYQNGKPNGIGCYTWPNGEYYDGEWMNGLKHGSGMWRGHRGDSYKGEWRFGKPQGYGVHTWLNGDTYEGEFKECLKHGEGIERFSNGDMYKGNYLNGKPSGYGEYYWQNGSYFKGNFINGLRDGKGIWKKGVGNSDRYDGNYRNDKKWGYGVFTWASGNVYKGNYEADLRNGFGEMYWVNGSYYKGQWQNGIQNGQGEIYIPTEGFKRGVFENNKIVSVWQERLVNKDTTLRSNVNKKKRRVTQQQQRSYRKNEKNEEDVRNRSFKGPKNKQNYRIREKSQPMERIRSISQKQAKNSFSYKKSLYTLKDNDKSYFQNKMIAPQEQRMNGSSNSHPLKQKLGTMTTKNTHSRQRLLHSSFYLYKLNLRHNNQTQTNLKRANDSSSKPAMLFRGKLLPSDI